jgi:hypothetical protein
MNDTDDNLANDCTAAEQAMLAAVLAGRVADLKGETVRSSMLRALVTEERSDWTLTPLGTSLKNATIQGTLDLEGCHISKPLVFDTCKFRPIETRRGTLRLRDARLKRMALYDCSIEGAIVADRMNVETALFLTGSTLDGQLRLRGAIIGEALATDGMHISHPGDVAILAVGIRVGGPWVMRNSEIAGEIRFSDARLGGGLLWEDVKIRNNAVAVVADGAVCDGTWSMRRATIVGPCRLRGTVVKALDAEQMTITAGSEAMNARGAEVRNDVVLDGAVLKGALLLGRAHIAGELSAKGAQFAGQGQDWAIGAGGLIVDQGVALAGAKLHGGILLAGARITQSIFASNIQIESSGRAIDADVMHVGGNWVMRGAKINGNIRLAGSQIDGQIGFTECQISGGGDLAIRADGAHVRGGWFMGRASITGLVRLPSAHLGNEMRLRGTRIEVGSGPALFASGVSIARELVLDGGFSAKGAIVLDRAEISGTLNLSGSRILSAVRAREGAAPGRTHDEILTERFDRIAVSLVDARLDRLVMPDTAETRPIGIVDLSRAHVGSYEDAAAAWPPVNGRTRKPHSASGDAAPDYLVLDGFFYDHLESPTGIPASELGASRNHAGAARMRKRWLEAQSGDDLELHFKPQAWVQLSRRLSAQGFTHDAREIDIARRRRQRRSASTSRSVRLQGWLLDVFALYGFNPWRTVLWMSVCILMFAAIWWTASLGCSRADCKDEQVFVMALKGNYGQDDAKAAQAYPGFAPLAYSLDVFLPFVNLGFKEHWRPITSYVPLVDIQLPGASWHGRSRATLTLGGILYCAYVVETLLGLILASLAVTGFAGLLRGEEEVR